jgi:hypothetical protein
MPAKPATVPQPKAKRSKFVKVSVLLPRKTYRNVLRIANDERRPLSPAIVLLVERGIMSPATVANASPAPPISD